MNTHTDRKATNSNDRATEKVLDRIRKLYAMSQQNEASPNEAEIALRRCQVLMERYGVLESDLETSEFDSVSACSIRKSIATYLTILASSAALLHDCLCVRTEREIQFRGYAIDAKVAPLSFEYLCASLDRHLKVSKQSGVVAAGRKASHDFRIGFAIRVHERCKEIDRERREQETSTKAAGTALVVRKMAMVNSNCGDDLAKPKLKKVGYRVNSANDAGRAAGESVSLNPQVGKDTSTGALLGVSS